MARLKTGWKNRSSSQLEQLATSFLDSFSMKNTVHKQVVGSSTSPSWPKYVDLRYIFDSKLVDNMATIEPLHFHHNEMSQVPIDVPSQSPTIAWKICSASFSPLVFSFPAGTSCRKRLPEKSQQFDRSGSSKNRPGWQSPEWPHDFFGHLGIVTKKNKQKHKTTFRHEVRSQQNIFRLIATYSYHETNKMIPSGNQTWRAGNPPLSSMNVPFRCPQKVCGLPSHVAEDEGRPRYLW